MNSLNEKTDFLKQLVIILVLCLLSVLLFSIVGAVVAKLLFNVNINHQFSYHQLANNEINALKIIQLFSSIGLFIIPPLIYAKLISKTPFIELGIKAKTNFKSIILTVLIMFIVMPFLSFTIDLNSKLVLPEFMSSIEEWMKQSEEEAMFLTSSFLKMGNLLDFFFIFFLVAILPAVGEELLFRGVLQKLFIKWTKKYHLGVWITAILFSALHMQFYGFLPRLILGVMFGYLFFWSKSLWLPIIAHLLNNGSVVIAAYINPNSINDSEPFSSSENTFLSILLIIISFSATTFLLLTFIKTQKNTT
ncbi:MAG: CPBP family intramembrane metalloprotease [Flavobacteriales bacterium]|nr:CPBP family intramembrane metalloprotease [Flavobacteriales bacterium]MCW8913151.1 CPBP family intramembrane metalloprotease [Flavobacteriales bacterium]MCW8937044.1 CPBP family intramembrane metalloprotease [Flavobacteriales bacterium]MCW8939518.1 CPBP family intramembrane metalloprotease [Flavobacteriales bacterium]MCW8967420.1 CPBP family intramembrane metalloprotease [Flavobacteriales bacterium]